MVLTFLVTDPRLYSQSVAKLAGIKDLVLLLSSEAKLDVFLNCDSSKVTAQAAKDNRAATTNFQSFVLKVELQSVFALVVIGCIVAVVCSPFVELPLVVHTRAHPGSVHSVRGLSVWLATSGPDLHWPSGAGVFGTFPNARFDRIATTCAYLC